jgi:hypothetical protein
MRTLQQSQIILLFIFVLFLSQLTSQESWVDSAIAQIPKKERKQISYFFRHAIFWDTYGYVLLGSKPCAISYYKKATFSPLSWVESLTPHNLKMKKGWKTWRKYEKLFPHPNFIFAEEDSPLTSAHFITLIRRDHFLEKIDLYPNDFQAVLETTNGEALLDQLKTKTFLAQVLKNHDGLIGTLLGYGRNNGWAFQTKAKNMHSFVNKEERMKDKNFCEAQGGWKFFTGSFDRDFSHMFLPGFVADPDDAETKYLEWKYPKEREQIIDYYRDKKFLEATLSLLCDQ